MIDRVEYIRRVETALARSPVVALLGPRQSGKTTLAWQLKARWRGPSEFFDLELPSDQIRLGNPEWTLGRLEGLVVLDEIQIQPVLFPLLRVLADRQGHRIRFLILGSASPQLVKGTSESLAGRVEFVDMAGFDLRETGADAADRLWLRGGFPRSFLADSEEDSLVWREGFIRTFLERDLPQLGITVNAAAMRRFWTMLAHYHGQTWNASGIACSMGLSDKTVRSYLDILTAAFMMRQLQPWHENIGKRQVKAPKVYFRDSGLLHDLLSLPDAHRLSGHPKVGASWEGFALEQLDRMIRPSELFYWATYSGAELDAFFIKDGERIGVEFKYATPPVPTRSMRIAMKDLALDALWILTPQRASPFELEPGVFVCAPWQLNAPLLFKRSAQVPFRPPSLPFP